eukprot:9520897-Lingulodinium_polyedra.AAC.1
MSAREGIQYVEALGQSIPEGNCARNNITHGPGKPLCVGMVELTATMVYNWRVLRWSSPQRERKEHSLHLFVESLRAHRASG